LNVYDVNGIKQALDLGYPVVITFNVVKSFDDMWGNGGIWSEFYGTSRGNHACCIIGYDNTRQMFIVN
jgi:C1A family cysteine protease